MEVGAYMLTVAQVGRSRDVRTLVFQPKSRKWLLIIILIAYLCMTCVLLVDVMTSTSLMRRSQLL